MLKPQPGLTKAQRKQYRLKATQQYANIDLSYNPNLSIRDVSIFLAFLRPRFQ